MFVDLLPKMLLLDLVFTKNDFWHYVYVKFNIFSVKYIFEKSHFKLQTGFYSNTVFLSYTDYIVNGEIYSLDMLATSDY